MNLNQDFCIGTAQFGMEYGIANQSGQPIQNEVNQIVEFAFENGIRFFDTAQSYGNSEFILGKALVKQENKNFVKIVSKLLPDIQECNTDIIVESVKSSINKLNVESLYGFLAHRVEAIYSGSYALAVQQLKNEGLIVKSGVSVYTPNEALTALENPLVEILQIPFNILDRRWIDEMILERAEEKNVQLMFRSIFLQGLIFLNDGDLKKRGMYWAKPYLDQFHKLVSETSFSALELSLGILSNISEKNVIIIGVDSFHQLKTNVKMIDNLPDFKIVTKNWWEKIPYMPERLLNPSLWDNKSKSKK